MSNLHEIIFTSWNTNMSKRSYTDFGVILTEQNIGLPSPKTYSVSIEGMDGSLDLSECFGEMKHENRTLKFTFESIDKITDWQSKMINISSFLHGQKMKIKTWSEPDFYYVGRCQIDEYNSSQRLGKIVVSCDCEPFKYKKNITVFNLTEGTNTVQNSRMTVYADLINEAEVTINTKVYSKGTHLRAIKLTSGANILNSSGNATLNFQEGEI